MSQEQVEHSRRISRVIEKRETSLETGIASSWNRCVNEFGLDPETRKNEVRIVPQVELVERQQYYERLRRIAREEMENLYQQIAGSGYSILLADDQGMILESVQDPILKSTFHDEGLITGAIWSEEKEGTNGIGTALFEKRPVTVHLDDHFRTSHIGLTCSGAPIINCLGNITGILDVSAVGSQDSRSGQQHTLALVNMTARFIENRLFFENQTDNFILRLHNRREFVGLLCESLLAISPEGKILAANVNTLTVLDLSSHNAIIGKSMDEVFDRNLSIFIDQAMRHSNSTIQVRDRRSGRRYYASLRIPTKIKRLQGLINNNAGGSVKQENASKSMLMLEELSNGDPAMDKLIKCTKRVVDKNISILLHGETGTGKEAVSQAIHNASLRYDKPFIAINCSAIPESLIESELFGYKDGTFTGAKRGGKKGKILQADGGTLFLDEIGDMPLELQTRLLRVLEEREVVALGSEVATSVDINVITATHRDLKQLVADGSFREDLYFRLNGITLSLPALRERRDKAHLLQKVIDMEKDPLDRVSVDGQAKQLLMNYNWPGNIRQLRNVMRTALALRDGNIITVDDLPEDIQSYRNENYGQQGSHEFTRQHEVSHAIGPEAESSVTASNTGQHFAEREAEMSSLACAERSVLIEELEKNRWNVTQTAKTLGISRATLYRKLNRYGIHAKSVEI